MKRVVDLIIHPRWIIPIVPHNAILHKMSVVINKGEIIDITSRKVCDEEYESVNEVILDKHVLLPGFINAHTHAGMYLFKSYGDDNDLMDWLNNYIWPMEKMFISLDFIEDSLRMGCAEMIRSGTTCFNDMYYFPEESAEIMKKIGMRAILGLMGRDKEGSQKTNHAILSKGIHPSPLLGYTIAPHSPYVYSDSSLKIIKQMCDQYGVLMHMHVQETRNELVNSIAGRHDLPGCHKSDAHCSPIQNMASLGILDNTCLAHCVHVLDEDIDLLQKHHASVVHCPNSNMKLGSGIAPVQKMLNRGVNVCLGTDGASSNNNLDMLHEMRSAALLGPLAEGDATAVPAVTALEMATINGAKALHIDDKVGSIEKGKKADLIAIDLDRIESLPINNIFSSIVYATGRDQVTHVWVEGNCLMEDRHLTTLNIEELKEKATKWQQILLESNPFASSQAKDACLSPF